MLQMLAVKSFICYPAVDRTRVHFAGATLVQPTPLLGSSYLLKDLKTHLLTTYLLASIHTA